MSEHLDLDGIRARIDAAHDEVVALCEGKRWQMRVPVDERSDSDVVITAGLKAGLRALAEVEEQRARADRAEAERDLLSAAHEAVVQRWDRAVDALERIRALALHWLSIGYDRATHYIEGQDDAEKRCAHTVLDLIAPDGHDG